MTGGSTAVGAGGEYSFKPHERATVLGSPANPDHPNGRRLAYFVIGCLIGITGGLGNGLVTVNLGYVQGSLGLYSNEVAWLTAAYLMTNVTANLLMVKYRQQFGLESFTRYGLVAYALTTLLHLVAHDHWTAIAVRAMNGLAAAALSTLALLYFVQSMPAPRRLGGLMIGICISQLGTPLARILSPGLLEVGDWRLLYCFELGMALACWAAVMWLPLPTSERQQVFERLDFLTFGLLAPALWLFIAVLSLGPIEWWMERPWIGWALASGTMLLAAAIAVEHRRANPLIDTRWLGSLQMVRLIVVAVLVRVLLSEQNFGSVGLLSLLGMTNDQMMTLNAIVLVASILGLATAVLSFHPDKVARPIAIAVLLIGAAAFMDANSSNLSRPEAFYLSQALVGFASLLFLGQAMVIGIARTLLAGGRPLIGFIVLFSISQSVGGLLGTALLGSFQTWRQKYHSVSLVGHLVASDPMVAQRLQSVSLPLSGTVADPVLRAAQAAAQLAQQVARESNVLAYNDVFLLLGALAVLTAVWGALVRLSIHRRGEVSPIVLLQLKMATPSQAPAPSTISPKATP